MIKYCFSIVVLVTFLSSCAPVYTPNLVNSPLFTQHNDVQLQGSVGLSGYDVQAAYSPINKLGIMANTTFFDSDNGNYTSRFYEGGVGYYQSFEETGRFECYAGFGNGQTELNKTIIADKINANYNRFFIQPGIGVKQDIFEASFCTRIAYVDIYDVRSNDPNLRPASSIFVEPVLTGRFGYKYVKFFTQFGLSMHTIDVLSLYSLPVILNFGMNLSFSELYKKSDKKKTD